MERSIDRFYLHLLSKSDLTESNCKEKNLEVVLEKKPTINFCKFLYKEVGRDFFGETDSSGVIKIGWIISVMIFLNYIF